MKFSLALLLVFFLSACGTLQDVDETKDWSVNKLYDEAKSALNKGDYENAVKYFEKVEARFPYGRYAQQSQLEIAYAHYKHKEPALALAAVERFIKLYPNHPNVDYAYYLRGLINFNDDLGYINLISSQDMTERDPKAARDAFYAFRELVTRYPESRYRPDSISRMNYLVNALASHEIHVARYYMKRGAFVAAANRAQSALKDYPQAPANEEGLLILVNAYDKLGMMDLRNDAERVMKANYPNSKYLSGRGADKPWWMFWQIWNQ